MVSEHGYLMQQGKDMSAKLTIELRTVVIDFIEEWGPRLGEGNTVAGVAGVLLGLFVTVLKICEARLGHEFTETIAADAVARIKNREQGHG